MSTHTLLLDLGIFILGSLAIFLDEIEAAPLFEEDEQMARQRFHSAGEIDGNPELAKTLLGHAEGLLGIEEQIAALRAQKADLFDHMRDAHFDPSFAKAYVAEKLADPEKVERDRLATVDRRLVLDALEAAEIDRARARTRATSVPADDVREAA